MSQKAIREFDAKLLLAKWMNERGMNFEEKVVHVSPDTDLDSLTGAFPWLKETKLVVKPDQLIKRRGKSGLLYLNQDWNSVKKQILDKQGKQIKVEKAKGVLDYFLIEPFLEHQQSDEYYISILSRRDGDEILFYHEGGVDIGDVDAKAQRLFVPIQESPNDIPNKLLKNVDIKRRKYLSQYINSLFEFYSTLHFTFVEINPLVMLSDSNDCTKNKIVALDMAAKIDETAAYECNKWQGNIRFPPPFGKEASVEEQYIADLDSKTGASLKLTILNPKGRIQTMVAGGGASVIYADTISDMVDSPEDELANYGEYSGAPSESLTYQYAKTILDLMTRNNYKYFDKNGKILIIGGGIANFTNVAETFKGIIRALREFRQRLIEYNVKIYVRRGGPNYQEGLNLMREVGETLGVPIIVKGPESHITSIVSMALKGTDHSSNNDFKKDEEKKIGFNADKFPHFSIDEQQRLKQKLDKQWAKNSVEKGSRKNSDLDAALDENVSAIKASKSLTDLLSVNKAEESIQCHGILNEISPCSSMSPEKITDKLSLFSSKTRAIVYGMQPRAVQNMLDFDYISQRKEPSVCCIVYPFAQGIHYRQFYQSSKEIMIPVYPLLQQALERYNEASVVVNFASSRSAYEATVEILSHPQIRTIVIIAEGVPERHTRTLIHEARLKGVSIIGPATVGGLKPGSFRIGNTGGMLDNIVASKLYRPGSVGYVSRSGGLSNELNNIISRETDGVYEGIAIGGDRFPITTYMDVLNRYEQSPHCKFCVLLGEVGGTLEYEVCKALKDGRLTKPLIAQCTGTCSDMFSYEVQFGHAGAIALGQLETATAKNKALKEAGAFVPRNFEEFASLIRFVYETEVECGRLNPKHDIIPPKIPMDYVWARKLGLIRKPSAFISSIVDERGDELHYSGVPISQVLGDQMGIGGVLGLIWFKRTLPKQATQFIEMVLLLTADHGPAVSGAHNTIVTARAGKDLISSLVSGLLTIGPRFGGALDGAAQKFSQALYDKKFAPKEFVEWMRKRKKLILGIGHKIKSVENPDKRVEHVVKFCQSNFKSTELLNYALGVEKVTTQKKSNLILNVDGAIGVAFVDLLRGCGLFSTEEIQEYIDNGALNGLFVLGRSIGFIGHYLDQKRLKQGLYRHPADDIVYLNDRLI